MPDTTRSRTAWAILEMTFLPLAGDRDTMSEFRVLERAEVRLPRLR